MKTNEKNINIEGLGSFKCNRDETLYEISKRAYGTKHRRYLGARIENTVYPLNKKIEAADSVEFLDNRKVDGYRIYTKTITAIFIKACNELFPDRDTIIHQFLGPGLYAEFSDEKVVSFKDLDLIEARMKKIIAEDIEIERLSIRRNEAIEIFKEKGNKDKVKLYETMDDDEVNVYKIGNHIDSFHGYLAPSTGYIDDFKLKYYYPGVIILFPSIKNSYVKDDFKDQRKLAKIFKEAKSFLEVVGLDNVGSLNERLINGEGPNIIRIAEALQEKRIAMIADDICKDKDITLVLIAGPSSSGKTTFASRLATQLFVNGKRPISISVDDYFVNRDKTPLNENGEPDFEMIEAIDLVKFNEDLISLLEGETIELPRFNFKTGKREESGVSISVDKNHPIIIEGIHGLNPILTADIPGKNKYKIYVSALTQLNLDNHNRISTTDTRLIRRMVRDFHHRGNDPIRTFELWEAVRRGEEKYIFPYQEEADVMFNSYLVYEMAVLKKHIVPLLQRIDKDSVFYSEAKKLLQFLRYFKEINNEKEIPPNSIIREFIGHVI